MTPLNRIRAVDFDYSRGLLFLSIANFLSAINWLFQDLFPYAVISAGLGGLLLMDRRGDYWAHYGWRNIFSALIRAVLIIDGFWILVTLIGSLKKHSLLYTLVFTLLVFIGTIVQQIHERKRVKALERSLISQIAEWKIDYTDFLKPIMSQKQKSFDEAKEEAKIQAQAKREEMISAWIELQLPTRRKLNLIYADIAPERALSPEVVAMSNDDLQVLKELSRRVLIS